MNALLSSFGWLALVLGARIASGFDPTASRVTCIVDVSIRSVAGVMPMEVPSQTSRPPRGRLGVEISGTALTLSEAEDLGLGSPRGAVVTQVFPGSPARLAGIQAEDVFVEVLGRLVRDGQHFAAILADLPPSTRVPAVVVRNRKPVRLNVTLGEPLVGQQDPAEMPRTTVIPNPRSVDDREETRFGIYFAGVPGGIRRLTPKGKGAAVVTVLVQGGSAQLARLATKDVVLKINGKELSSVENVIEFLKAIPSGHSARVLFWRPGADGGSERVVFLK